jgi:hypothetical protein
VNQTTQSFAGNKTFTGTIAATNLSGTNTGDQTITLTGNVTGSGTGSFATTIAAGVVSNSMLVNAPANTIKGNNTGSPATPVDLTVSQALTLLGLSSSSTPTFAGLTIGSIAGIAKYTAGALSTLSGTSAQYVRGDATLQTLNQAAVAGLTTADSPTFTAVTAQSHVVSGTAGAGYIEYVQQASVPSTPAAGKDRLYAKADDKLYRVSSAGISEALAIEGSGLNFLLNGNLDIWQRGTSITSQVYSADRFAHSWTASAITVSQSTTVPADGQTTFSMQLTGSVLTTQTVDTFQRIEAAQARQLAGKNVTVSFWMNMATTAGTATLSVVSSYPTVTDTFGTRTAIASTNITSPGSGTWGLVSCVIAVPAAATTGLEIRIRVTQSVATGTLTLYLTRFMLNSGSVPAPFQLATGNLGSEISACQRFYQKTYNQTVPPGTVTGAGYWITTVLAVSTLNGNSWLLGAMPRFIVPMRAAPTVSLWTNTGVSGKWNVGTEVLSSTANVSTQGFEIVNNSGGALTPTAGFAYGQFTAEAEL